MCEKVEWTGTWKEKEGSEDRGFFYNEAAFDHDTLRSLVAQVEQGTIKHSNPKKRPGFGIAMTDSAK